LQILQTVQNRDEINEECRIGNATFKHILAAAVSEGVDEYREITKVCSQRGAKY
jgi:hypothetical protein